MHDPTKTNGQAENGSCDGSNLITIKVGEAVLEHIDETAFAIHHYTLRDVMLFVPNFQQPSCEVICNPVCILQTSF